VFKAQQHEKGLLEGNSKVIIYWLNTDLDLILCTVHPQHSRQVFLTWWKETTALAVSPHLPLREKYEQGGTDGTEHRGTVKGLLQAY
jgi:hypothetical protein